MENLLEVCNQRKPTVWLVDCDDQNDTTENFDKYDHYGGALCIHPKGILLGVQHVVRKEVRRLRARKADEDCWRPCIKRSSRRLAIRGSKSLDISLFAVEREDGESDFPCISIRDVEVNNLCISQYVWMFGHRDLVPFSWSSGTIAYPLPSNVYIPDYVSDDDNVELLETDFVCRGQNHPYRKVSHIIDTRQRGNNVLEFASHFHPDLPLIEVHGVDIENGFPGCPLWGVNGQLLGLCSFKRDVCSYFIPIQVLKHFCDLHLQEFSGRIESIVNAQTESSPKIEESKKKRKNTKDKDEPKSEGSSSGRKVGSSSRMQSNHVRHCPLSRFDDYETNKYVDICTKRTALKASTCVVSITSSLPSGAAQGKDARDRLSHASGFVLECEEKIGGYSITILSTASLLRCPDVQASEFKVDVHVFNGRSYKGHVLASDFHYNLALIRIQSESSLPAAILRSLDDSISIDPSVSFFFQGSQLRAHSELFNIVPGDKITALGRYFEHPYDLMIAPGVFSADGIELDCDELLRANCQITKSGIGGPLLNCHGEVIGITFYSRACTPFLPSNIVSKWVDHFKRYGDFHRPLLGIQVTNLYAAREEFLEKILHKFPGTEKGVYVEKVAKGSPAFEAGLHEDDIIIQCGGKVIQSALQLFEATFDLAGKSTVLVVKRASSAAQLNPILVVGEATPDIFNRWPLPPRVYMQPGGGGRTRGC